MGCPRCGAEPEVGVLCRSCAAALPACDGLLPDHVSSPATTEADAWLIDGFGTPHAVAPGRTRVGRRPGSELVILHGSVSRDHAELARGGGGWAVRDLGSRNGTRLDGRRVEGRGAVADLEIVTFGEVALLFVGRALPLRPRGELATTHAASVSFRVVMRGEALELCVLGSTGDDTAGGALLHRAVGSATWAELSLPPLEFQLLRALCARALADADSPARTRGCLPTKQLARELPFQSRYANEENVRQVVRRLRGTLDEIGAAGLIEAVPGRGYYVTWPVDRR